MGMTMTQKILAAAAGLDKVEAGQLIEANLSLVLGNDITSPVAMKEMEKMSWFLDVSHLNDDGFEDIVSITESPFLATHSCSKTVYDNYRNLTDEQMGKLAVKGGVMGINGCRLITGSQSGNHLEMRCRHAEYEVPKIGAEHVGFGFDLCDSYDRSEFKLRSKAEKELQLPKSADCFLHHGQIPLFTAAL